MKVGDSVSLRGCSVPMVVTRVVGAQGGQTYDQVSCKWHKNDGTILEGTFHAVCLELVGQSAADAKAAAKPSKPKKDEDAADKPAETTTAPGTVTVKGKVKDDKEAK